MTETKKVGFLQAKGHSQLSNGTATAVGLAPGERVLFNEDDPQHKYERQLAEGGDSKALFEFVEVDLKAEAAQNDEQQEMLAKAEELAATQRLEQAQNAQKQLEDQQDAEEQRLEDGAPSSIEGTDFPPQDEEAQKLAEQSGAGQRASTQEDVVEEHGSKSGRRSARGKG
jgi:hypothetical protein